MSYNADTLYTGKDTQDVSQGTICNIQKFSLNDGPGIRTVVFLSGCPLACKWCANPESQKIDTAYEGTRLMTVAEVVEECLKDLPFYQESGGGVTLSGGEPLVQCEFACALLKALKEQEIHTAIETTGFVDQAVLGEALPLLDHIFYDIKHWDSNEHKQGTGVSNESIISNLSYVMREKSEHTTLTVRIPVILGFNDSVSDVEGFVQLFKELGVNEVQLLPFHQFGESKYEKLGKPYAYKGAKPLHEEDLIEYVRVFHQNDIQVFF